LKINKIGITGATGVLRKLFVGKLKENKLKYNCFEGDICSKKDIPEWLARNKLDIIVHIAAIVPTIEVTNNNKKAYFRNVIGTKNLINIINSSG